MLQLIVNSSYADFREYLGEMFRLRARVFSGRLGWDVSVVDGIERDQYDDLEPVYILQRDRDERVCGCVRLLPTTGPTMLRDMFPQLLRDAPMPWGPRVWETSRFAIDAPALSAIGVGGAPILWKPVAPKQSA
jgi:acyl homoserine lactone synthase